MKKKETISLSKIKTLMSFGRVQTVLSLIIIGMAIASCHGSGKSQSSDSTQVTIKVDTFRITDNLALNKEYNANPDTFKKKYLNHYATFDGYFFKRNPFKEDLVFLLRYPGTDKIGTDQINVIELRFNTPKPQDVAASYFSQPSDNKYWIFDKQSNKLIEQMNTHTSSDINEQPLGFYKAKIEEYIDEPSQETKGYLLGYNDNALRQVFTKYNQLIYKPTSTDDLDYNNNFILNTITVKGEISEINVAVDGSVWMRLSDEKIINVKNGFTMDGAKSIDVGPLIS
jgi:hypothetical protein